MSRFFDFAKEKMKKTMFLSNQLCHSEGQKLKAETESGGEESPFSNIFRLGF